MLGLGYGVCKAVEKIVSINSDERDRTSRDQQGRATAFGFITPFTVYIDPIGTSAYIGETALNTIKAERDRKG